MFSKPKVARKLSRDSGWESVWEDHFPDHEEKLLKNFFLKSASEVELQTMVREVFTITEKASTRAYSWLKAPLSTSALSFKTLLRHYATPALTHSK